MKYFTFERENNNFKDIENDLAIKKYFRVKIYWKNHFYVGISDEGDEVIDYLVLKYGDDLVREICPDRSPVEGVDYTATRRPRQC